MTLEIGVSSLATGTWSMPEEVEVEDEVIEDELVESE